MLFNSLLLIPSETYTRDFESRFAIAAGCASKGIPSIIGHRHEINLLTQKSKGEFYYLDRSLDIRSENWYQEIQNSGGSIFNLDEEGGIYLGDGYDDYLISKHKQAVLDRCELDILWGKKQESIIRKNRDVSSNQLISPGNPRFDLIKPGYQYFPKFKKPYILINTNFSMAYGYLSLDEEIKSTLTVENDKIFISQLYNEIYQYNKKLFPYFCELAEYLTSKGISVVLRPHPGENPLYYKQKFKKNPAVKVTDVGNPGYWITNAELVIHHDCTTAIEACIAGTKYVSYQPILDKGLCTLLPLQISDAAKTPTEVLNYINDGKISFNERKKLIKDVIHNVDDTDSLDIITNAIIRRVKENGVELDFSMKPYSAFKNILASWRKKLKMDWDEFSLSMELHDVNLAEYRGRKKFTWLNEFEMQRTLSYWRNRLNCDIKMKRILPNSVLLYNDDMKIRWN